MGTTTDRLVTQAADGQADALSDLLERFGDRLAGHLEGHIDPKWQSLIDVDDVVQVTFLEAFLQIGELRVRNGATFFAWLRHVADNNLRDAIRGLEAEKRPHPGRHPRQVGGDQGYVTLFEMLGGGQSSAGRKAARAEVRQLLESAIGKLPPDYEKVVRLHDLQGMPAPQVGKRIGKSRGAVHMIRTRALARLKDVLGAESDYFSDAS